MPTFEILLLCSFSKSFPVFPPGSPQMLQVLLYFISWANLALTAPLRPTTVKYPLISISSCE